MGFLIIIATFIGMEGVAWFTHKYIMHGLLWVLHEDHHVKTDDDSIIEKNDSFFLVFAIPSMALFALWNFMGLHWALYVALGIALYGLAYFLVHDIFIHQRIGLFKRSNNHYLRAIRKAHKIHHKHLTRFNGECFGMLLVPLKYFRELRKLNQ
ncbi:MAG: sterol desaturase family protein [Saprospiraceae bacterium]